MTARDGRRAAAAGHHERWDGADDVATPSERSFGLTFAVVFALLAAWFFWRRGLTPLPAMLAGGSAAFLAGALTMPQLLRPLNVAWFRFGMLLHAVVNPLILGMLYFLVITPTALIMRLGGKDFLGLRRTGPSYWIPRDRTEAEAGSMTNQF